MNPISADRPERSPTPALRNRAGSATVLKLVLAALGALLGLLGIGSVGGHHATPSVVSSAVLPPPPPPANDTTFYLGPVQRNGATGSGNVYVDQLSIPTVAGRIYKLRIQNGTAGGANRVTSAVTKWNGYVVVEAGELTSSTAEVTEILSATPTDTLSMTVVGPAGSYVTVSVFSVTSPEYVIFGQNTYNIPSGTTKTYTPSFTKPATAAATYRMLVINGDSLGANRVTTGQIKLNGTTVFPTTELTSAKGSLAKTVTVTAGSNSLNIVLNGSTGKFIKLRITATDTTDPGVTITTPVASSFTNQTTVSVTGTLSDETITTVTVNGVDATVTGNTAYANTASLSSEGSNLLTVIATDGNANSTTVTRTITRDTQAPTLTVAHPVDSTFTKNASVTVDGTVSDATVATVNTNGTPWTVSAGNYTGSFSLAYGSNTLVTTATDQATNTTSIARLVVRDTLPPSLTVSAPTNGTTTNSDSILVTGTVSDPSPVTVAGNGVNLPVVAGAFSGKVPLSLGANTINVVATDRATNATTIGRTVTRLVPPDPDSIAPPLSQTVASTIGAATAFLYTGSNPIQAGVTPGTIQPTRVAVLRGKVLDSLGIADSGVTVSILGHPEFGSTVTRRTGMFDLAVNGGTQLTVNYSKPGLLTGQRNLQVPWQDYVHVDSIALVSPGRIVDSVRFNQPMQVIRADSVSDASGGRRPSLMFRDSTVVTAQLPGGGNQVLSGPLAIRVQEFTVGTLGAARMPAQLPPTSAYTYAIALNIDSALKLASPRVTFSKPVAVYVDNYLGFPVGAIVPVGAYEPAQGQWVAQADGRVIKILSISSGLANLAIDSSGAQATPTQLATLGIDSLERTRIATTYPAGKVLWRVTTDHFSLIDFNHGESFPLDWILPNGGAPIAGLHLPNCNLHNSIVGCENQTLGEALPVVGAPFSLYYESDRAPGYGPDFGIDIPLRGDTIPPSVTDLYVSIDIAGQHFEATYPRSVFRIKHVWNGKDGYGRYVQGRQNYTIGVGFVYNLQYNISYSGGGGGGSFGGYLPVVSAITGPRKPIVLVQWRGTIGPWNAAPLGLGGWTLSAHHAYDPTSKTLHLGTGERREAVAIGNTLAQVGGTGALGFSGDGGPAIQALMRQPADVAVAPDGSIYLSDEGNQRIRKIAPDGTITTVAGTGTPGYSGDNGPATSAQLNGPEGVALAPDGSLYIADRSNSRIRKISPTGTITTVAGDGTAAFAGDGGLATAASLHFPVDVVVAGDGSVYIADQGSFRVRRVTTNGYITTVAGNGVGGYGGNGGLATQANLYNITGIALGPDGALYISAGDGTVRRVGTDGVITHFAGTDPGTGLGYPDDGLRAALTDLRFPDNVVVGPDGTVYIAEKNEAINPKRGMRIDRVLEATGILSNVAGHGVRACGMSPSGVCKPGDDGDGGLAGQGYLYSPTGMALAPNGDLIFAEPNGNQIRKITAAQPGLALGTMLIASADGGLVYEFDAAGKHQKTRDALTGATLLTFGYDTLGKVATITDADNNVTTIQRNAQGNPTTILAPFGQQTTLTTAPTTGFLSSVANPGGEIVKMWYKTNGLLDSLADPKNQVHRFTYDSIGQLISDVAPGGVSLALSRTPYVNSKTSADTGFKVTVTSGQGRATDHTVEFLPSGQTQRTVSDPAGFKTVTLVEPGQTTLPDSSVITVSRSGDPRWGMQAPTIGTLSVKLPSGLTSAVTSVRHDSLSNASDLLSLVSQTDSVAFNSKWSVSSYTAATRRLVQTSPEGRQLFSSFDTKGRIVSAQVAGLDSVRFVYDGRGRVDSVIEGGRKTMYSYSGSSGRLSSVTDPLSRVTQFSYDSAGRVKTQTLPDGRLIQFVYDLNGNLTSLTPPGRPAHGFQYTAVDLAKQYDPPTLPIGAKPTKYFYNLDRQVDSLVRPDSITVGFGYDAAGRASSVSFDRGTTTFGYSSTTGALTSIREPGGDSLKFSYDGALVTQVKWKGTLTDSVRVHYNADFRVDSQYVHGGNVVGFGYDNDGFLTLAGGLGLRRSTTNGLLLADSLGVSATKAVKTSYAYTSRGELQGMHAARNGTALFGTGYVRDSLGRITQLFDTTQGTAQRWGFVYDSVGRLKADSINGAVLHAFTYDSNGNRASSTSGGGTVTYWYDAQDRLDSTKVGGGTATKYTYGSNGELKSKVTGASTTTYSYDALGNLIKVVFPGAADSVEYLIDGQNRRVGRKLNGVVTHRWIYQNQLNPVAELDGAGNVVSRFVYGTRLNVPDYVVKGGNTYRLITDHLGSVRLVVDTATGTVAQRFDYDEFGVATVVSGAGFQPFGFVGGLTDDSAKLVRFGARDYDPAIGRWTARDPLLIEGGMNLYRYVGSDPVNRFDPMGLCPCDKQSLVGLPSDIRYNTRPGVRPYFAPDFADDVARAIRKMNERGITPTINDGFRTAADQAARRAAAGASPNQVASGTSYHQAGYAIDFGPNTNSPNFGVILSSMSSVGFFWAGNWAEGHVAGNPNQVLKSDDPHFQYAPPAGWGPGGLAGAAAAAEKYYEECIE